MTRLPGNYRKFFSTLFLSIMVVIPGILPASKAQAQDLSGLSIAIDPGHGRGTPNQGPTGLREADINVAIGLFLRDFLRQANIDTVLMTRVDDSINPSLSQREALANRFGVDWFHSIHHNEFDGTRRFTLLLYEEARTTASRCADGSPAGTGAPEWQGFSDVMSAGISQDIFTALRTSSHTERLDWSFYGGCNGGFSLGVLNDLTMPGELSEGTFHDNAIEERKLRNPDFLKLEARAIYMAFLDFFEAGKMPTGVLSGIVTDEENGAALNGALVTLQPGNLTQTTDNAGSGFYAFHDLPPGNYTVQVSYAGRESTPRQVTVPAHAFTYSGLIVPSGSPPVVDSVLPANGATEVDVYKEIGIRFNRAMNRESVENAFTIGPNAAGHFIWSNSDDLVLFEPDTRFDFDTEYTVRIDGSATDADGRPLDGNGDGNGGDAFLWDFATRSLDNSRPVVMFFSPARRDTGVFVRDVIQIRFNRKLDPASVNSGTVLLTGNAGATVSLQVVYLQDIFNTVLAIPREPLDSGTRHFITLTNGIALPDGTPLPTNFRWQFTTQGAMVTFDVLDNFADAFSWTDPDLSARTHGTDPDSTTFSTNTEQGLADSSSGKLRYLFLSSDAELRADFLRPIDIDVTKTRDLGVYVYGDNSRNDLRLFLRDSDGEESLPATNINWLGWRLVKFALATAALEAGIGGNGSLDATQIQIAGIGLRLTAQGQSTGEIFVDDLFRTQPAFAVFVEQTSSETGAPRDFVLRQNFPNPFNPGTVIAYDIRPESGFRGNVTLDIFNVGGQRVRRLVNADQGAGLYRATWDGRDQNGRLLPNGIYIYRLRAGNFSDSKRMLLLK